MIQNPILNLSRDELILLVNSLREEMLVCSLELESNPDSHNAKHRLDKGRHVMSKIALFVIETAYNQQEIIYEPTEPSDMATRPELN